MALVLTLLVVAVVTAMVVEFAYGVYVSTSSLQNWQTSQKLSVAARSAIKLAGRLISYGLQEKTVASHEISQKIPYDDPAGTITLRIEDDGAKLNLNKVVDANRKVNEHWHASLVRLLGYLELSPETADRIAWWISPEAMPSAGPPDAAKGAPLDSIDELLLIPGIERETYEKLLPYVTISGSGLVNINTAPVPVLMSLHEDITRDMAGRIIARRELAPFSGIAEIQQAGVSTTLFGRIGPYISADGRSFSVTAVAESGGIKRVIESVIDTGGVIRFWREG